MPIRDKASGLAVFAALGVLGLCAAALSRRRFRLGFFLFHVAVALGEAWSDRRARRAVARALSARAASPAVPGAA